MLDTAVCEYEMKLYVKYKVQAHMDNYKWKLCKFQ
jgi:hypothetical protein